MNTCPFCQSQPTEKLAQNQLAYAKYDIFPVSEGHALIIANRHIANWFELSFEEQTACIALVNEMKNILQIQFNPDGFNIGINIGETAGQTINHVHIHLIPRYKGDVENPRGGIRSVIPSKQNY